MTVKDNFAGMRVLQYINLTGRNMIMKTNSY